MCQKMTPSNIHTKYMAFYAPSAVNKHNEVIKWKHFHVTGHLCGEFIVHRWIPCKKASDTELWCFLWSWINGWVNNREAGDLRRHRAHYDVIVMLYIFPKRYQLHIPFTNTLAIFVKHTMLNAVSQMFQKMMPLNIYIKHMALSARKAVDKTSSTMKASWRRNAILMVDSNHKRPVIWCFFVVTLNQHLNKQPSFR